MIILTKEQTSSFRTFIESHDLKQTIISSKKALPKFGGGQFFHNFA